jgi:hypothetical protein
MGEKHTTCHHIVLFFKGSIFELQPLLWKKFTIFLHIVVSQNPKKSNAKKIISFYLYDVILHRFVPKICTSHHIKKCKYIQEIIQMILIFMKIVVFIKHYDSIWLE